LPYIERKVIKFGFSEDADIRAYDVRLENGRYKFKVNDFGEIHLSVPGIHNVYNALATIAICNELSVPFCVIKESLENFKNAKRRFEIKYSNDVVVIDDYAHHPTELKATLSAARDYFKDRRMIAVFQPHRYSRLNALFEEFAKAFDIPDITIITEVYSAGESPIENVSGEKLAGKIRKYGKNVYYVANLEEAENLLKNIIQKGDVILTLGAGSITQLSDTLAKYLSEKE